MKTRRKLGPLLVKTAGMALVVSCAMTALTTGLGGDFALRWLRAYCFGWPTATLLHTVLLPYVRRRKHRSKVLLQPSNV